MTPDPVTPVHTYRVDDFAAYFRLIRNRLEATSLQDPTLLAAENYPEPVDHCEICRWQKVCDKKRRADDHLSLVAGMRRLQSRELEAAGISTLTQFGELPLPLPFTPRRGAVETYIRLPEQARVQLEGRIKGEPVHELLLPIEADQGVPDQHLSLKTRMCKQAPLIKDLRCKPTDRLRPQRVHRRRSKTSNSFMASVVRSSLKTQTSTCASLSVHSKLMQSTL